MNQTDIVDILEKERRFRHLQESMQFFSDAKFKIYSIMPVKTRYYPEEGKMEEIIEPEWQKLIDKINTDRNEFIKNNFPEFQ